MARWLAATVVLALVGIGGWIAFLNRAPVTVLLWPTYPTTAPLGIALLVAFAVGATFVGVFALTTASRRRIRSWRRRRLARREASNVAQLAQHAETLLDDGDAAGARTSLDGAHAAVDTSPRLLGLLAEAAERAGDIALAASTIEKARALEPESPRVARRLRDVYVRAGRWSEAVAVQSQLLLDLRDPTIFATEERLLRCYRYEMAMAESDDGRAARMLRALAREDRTFLAPAIAAGDRYVAAGKPATARRLWARAAKRRPVGALLDRLEGVTPVARMVKYHRAIAQRHGEASWLRLRQARFLLANDSVDEALEALGHLPDAMAVHPTALALRADVHRRRGEHDRAAELFAQAVVMPATVTCTTCHQPATTWSGRCNACGAWDTLA